MKLKIVTLVLLLLPVMGMGAKMAKQDPDEYRIKQELLVETPLGSNMGEIMDFCIENNLKCKRFNNFGYVNGRTGESIGVKSIEARIKEYKETPLTITNIAAYWGFDKDERLIDIFVWKTIDAP